MYEYNVYRYCNLIYVMFINKNLGVRFFRSYSPNALKI